MGNSAGPDDAPDTAPDQHVRPRHVAPLRTANDRTVPLGLERPPTTAKSHTRPLAPVALEADLVAVQARQVPAEMLEWERPVDGRKSLARINASLTHDCERRRKRRDPHGLVAD